jgi:hypothetical protein
MKIIKELKKLERDIQTGNFPSLKCGNYSMSVQGSEYHYSIPKKVVSVNKYACMELAIFDKYRNWVFSDDEILSKFHRLEELKAYSSGSDGNTEVFAHVPIALLNDLFYHMRIAEILLDTTHFIKEKR